MAFRAADAMSLSDDAKQHLRLAALLHDVGRAGVASGLWDKPGELSSHERQILESHNGHTETVLGSSASLRPLEGAAGGVHERTDKTGYPRSNVLGDESTGLLAASDIYEALTHERPWRSAFEPTVARDMLLEESKAGRLRRRAVTAVRDTAGHGKARRATPPGSVSGR